MQPILRMFEGTFFTWHGPYAWEINVYGLILIDSDSKPYMTNLIFLIEIHLTRLNIGITVTSYFDLNCFSNCRGV